MPVRHVKEGSFKKRTLSLGDLVIEISGGSPTQSTGRPVLVTEGLLQRLDKPLTCSNFCRMLRFSDPAYSLFIYLWLRLLYSNDELLQYETGTTGIKNLAFTRFTSQHRLVLPPLAVFKSFDDTVRSYYNLHQINGIQDGVLSTMRDELLPRLMTGEILQ
jgi:type I restriction enzyme S subunit